MFNEEDGTLRAVAWSEVCPWLKLFRCFRLAIRFRLLLLSAIAVLLTVSGWAFFVIFFSGDPAIRRQLDPAIARQLQTYPNSPWLAFPDLVRSVSTDLVPNRPQLPNLDVASLAENLRLDLVEGESTASLRRSPEPFWGTFMQLSRPIRQIFSSEITGTRLALLLLCGLWTLAVWAFFGGAITRAVAVELALEERVGWGAMIRHAGSRWRAYFAAPLMLLVGVLACTLGIGLVGVLLWSDVSLLLVALLFWPLMLVGGWVMAFLLLWLAFGWPLMWPAISVEGNDSFDALSRSRDYLFQRPLHYLFYGLVAVLLGWLGWLVVSNFAAAVIALTNWAADWGADSSRWLADSPGSRRTDLLLSGRAEAGALGSLGAGLILFWCGCVKMLAVGFLYSYFWTASTCIYLLLRHDADATELDEIFIEEDQEEPPGDLPPLKTDRAGAPVVADDGPPPEDSGPKSEDTAPPSEANDPSADA